MSEIEALGNLLGGEYLNHWRRTYKDAHGRILNNVVSCICLIITLSVMKLKKKSEDSVTAENKHTDKKGKAGSSHAKK